MDGTKPGRTPVLDDEFLKTVMRLTLAVPRPPSRTRPPRRGARRPDAANAARPRPKRTPAHTTPVSPSTPPVDAANVPFASPARSPQDLEMAALCHLFHEKLTTVSDLRVSILLDAGESMAFPRAASGETSKFTYARRLAAAFGYAALVRYDQVQVTAFAARAGGRTPTVHDRDESPALLRYLETVRAGGEGFARALEQFAARNAGPGVYVIISDFLDPQWEKGIRALLSRRFEVVLLQVLTPSEVTPHVGEDLRLVNADTGQARDVALGAAASARYQAALQQFFGMLGDAAGRHGMEYLRITTSTPFEEALLSTLRRAASPRRS